MTVETEPSIEASVGCTATGCDSSDSTKSRIRGAVISQFARPRGAVGRLAGAIMARRASNVERNRWTVSRLDLRPTDRVLEIGFGPGIAIAAASREVGEGQVVGLDHSETMWRQASRRNLRAIQEGRVRLEIGTVDDLGVGGLSAGNRSGDGPARGVVFDKIFAVNCAQFWMNPVTTLKVLAAHLVPGGTIALTEQPRSRGADEAAVRRAAGRLESQLGETGFIELRCEALPLKPVEAVCVLGRKPGLMSG